jgi:hypothetical protein
MFMFSFAERSWSEVMAWGMTPIDLRTSFGERTTSKPLMRAVPEVGGISVVSMRMRVDFPAPLGPSKPKISPSCTAKLKLSTAQNAPKHFLISRTSTAGTSLFSFLFFR